MQKVNTTSYFQDAMQWIHKPVTEEQIIDLLYFKRMKYIMCILGSTVVIISKFTCFSIHFYDTY